VYEAFRGEVVSRRPTEVVLEVGGIAYRFSVPLSTSNAVPAEGPVRLLCHLVVRDDKLELVGFLTEPERTLFRHLIGVSGIGPAVALQVLSRTSVPKFVAAVRDENRAFLGAIKGVGKKTVDRILVELREPLTEWDLADVPSAAPSPAVDSPVRDEAVQALGTLGVSSAAARKAVERAVEKLGPEAPLEDVVRLALSMV
jgi:Holliday junction DNA helicase RuvA